MVAISGGLYEEVQCFMRQTKFQVVCARQAEIHLTLSLVPSTRNKIAEGTTS